MSSKNVNPFEVATVAKPKSTAVKKSDRVIVEISGLELVAALDAAEKSIKALKTEARAEVDGQMFEYFVKNGLETGRQPESFRGVEGKASASCQMNKRGTRSALTEVEIEVLTNANIPMEVIEDQAETFIINPEFLSDGKLMAKVAKLLAGNVPDGFIQKQVSQKKTVVTDDSMIKAFAVKSEAKLRELLAIVGSLSLKPVLEENLSSTFRLIAELVKETE